MALVAASWLIVGQAPPTPVAVGEYEVVGDPQSPPLRLELEVDPGVTADVVSDLAAGSGTVHSLERVSERRFVITLPEDTEIGAVSRLRATLKDDPRVQRVEIITD